MSGQSSQGSSGAAPVDTSPVPLATLTRGLLETPADILVRDVTLDSRSVGPGALFLACRGGTRHGLEFASQAIERGAVAVLYEGAGDEALALGELQRAARERAVYVAGVTHLGRHAGTIAARFFHAPSQALEIAAVTGTNGKTTCAYLLAQALTHCGRPAGYMGTLGCGLPGALRPSSLTTLDAVSVQRELAALRALGAVGVGMEVSSHALTQARVDAVRFRAAAFTNLTRDHLDFHGSMQAYGAAKARLFEPAELVARVINVDDDFGVELAARHGAHAGAELILTARTRPAPAIRGAQIVRATRVVALPTGIALSIATAGSEVECTLPLIGEFNADNALIVLGLLLGLGLPLERAAEALGASAGAPGRMERIIGPGDVLAIVDYAHTPDALAKALRAARAHCAGTLCVVFGCGGDRDRGKRAPMGHAAGELADEIILTDDNPRTEDAERIVAEIRAGIGAARVVVEHDRAAAIAQALARSRPGDVVLIAGKGHEDYQIYGRERRAFSDQAVVRALWGLDSVEGRA
jgi:UDP-N-acetylmuramoyl-L-alanyl-D-glutamate--2,6-diaminopimelate ligase